MASVSSLDQDMRKLRLDRYTPAAISETRAWIESTLHESLAAGDLLDALKDGVALCKLANMVLPPPGIKYKVSNMPFTQRENISSFLTACENPPLNLPGHDRFLTVDLFDNKDPAQVLQCIGAFSRAAHTANPSKFPTVIGPKRQPSPTRNPEPSAYGVSRGQQPSSMAGTRRPVTPTSPTGLASQTSPVPVSSWSNKQDEYTTSPAWHLQYGYMGGASQGNQGVAFGARRQIISPDVQVPSLAEKEKLRRQKEAEADRLKLEAQKAEAKRGADLEAAELRARMEEEQRWEEETKKARERERQLIEEEKARWAEEERRWKEEEEQRRAEVAQQQQQQPLLRGQSLSQYQSELRRSSSNYDNDSSSKDDRIQQLERQLQEARDRERQYEAERQERTSRPLQQQITPEGNESSTSYRRPMSLSPSRQPAASSSSPAAATPSAVNNPPPPLLSSSSRPLPNPPPSTTSSAAAATASPSTFTPATPTSPPTVSRDAPAPKPRPLPDPIKSTASPSASPFTRPQASPFARANSSAKSHVPAEMTFSSTSEQAAEDARRVASQAQTKVGGAASKSLLEREMERERERQREWEQNQMQRSQGTSNTPGRPDTGRLLGPR